MHEAEQDWLKQATARAKKLRALPLLLDQLPPAAKALVVSSAAYWWVGRVPTKKASKKFFTSLTKYGPQRMAFPFIRQIVYGCKVHLEGVLLQRLWNRAVSLGALVMCNKAGPLGVSSQPSFRIVVGSKPEASRCGSALKSKPKDVFTANATQAQLAPCSVS